MRVICSLMARCFRLKAVVIGGGVWGLAPKLKIVTAQGDFWNCGSDVVFTDVIP